MKSKLKKLPADTKFVKPIALVKLADGTYFENGDLVYVKNEKSPAKAEKVDQTSEATQKTTDKKEEKPASKKSSKTSKQKSRSNY